MQTIEVEDSRLIAYEEWGDLRGRPMFQLHGTPGSRLSRHPDATLYPSLHLHVVTIDRPGYGGSTALPGRRVSHGAHDVAAFADELGLDRFFVVGGSGGGPHALACAAELGDRVLGCAPVASAAPLIPAEIDGLLGINHKGFQVLADSGR
jgi:pimeloyl-ACP methyl ester carboxylesterase